MAQARIGPHEETKTENLHTYTRAPKAFKTFNSAVSVRTPPSCIKPACPVGTCTVRDVQLSTGPEATLVRGATGLRNQGFPVRRSSR
jgi:hypothetical protein